MATRTQNIPLDRVSCDVVIVGGSIAGNYLASLLAGKGLEVHVIEAHSTIGIPMKCAGIVSSKILKIMNIPKHLILNQISEARVYSKYKDFVTIRTRDMPLVLDRIAFDHHFMELAKQKGVTYHLGERVERIEPCPVGLLVWTPKRAYSAKVVAGCDGAHSAVARHAGIVHEFITGKQVTIKDAGLGARHGIIPPTCEIHFDPRWNDLFAWVIPTAGDSARVGLATRVKVADSFEKFFSWRFGRTLDDVRQQGVSTAVTPSGGTIPVGLPTACAFDRTLLVGDAACQVKASTGGGIVMLAIAARYAARAIQLAFHKDDFSRRFFIKHYQTPFFKQTMLNLKMHLAIHTAIKYFTEIDFSRLFTLANKPSVKLELARTADMDFPVKFILRILGEPGFYWWVAGFLLRSHRVFKEVLGLLFLGKTPGDACCENTKHK